MKINPNKKDEEFWNGLLVEPADHLAAIAMFDAEYESPNAPGASQRLLVVDPDNPLGGKSALAPLYLDLRLGYSREHFLFKADDDFYGMRKNPTARNSQDFQADRARRLKWIRLCLRYPERIYQDLTMPFIYIYYVEPSPSQRFVTVVKEGKRDAQLLFASAYVLDPALWALKTGRMRRVIDFAKPGSFVRTAR